MMPIVAGIILPVFVALLATIPPARAQQPARIPRICMLAPYPVAQRLALHTSFVQGLHELGYEDGRNITISYFSADGRFDRFPALAEECLRLKPDVIVTQTTPGALAAKKATSTVPIVSAATGDPVATGIVASLARPGGNVTGLSLMSAGLSGKRLELLTEAVPGISRVAVLSNLADPVAAPQVKELEEAARILRIRLKTHAVRTPDELPAAFTEAARDRADGFLTTIEAIFTAHRGRVLELAARHRLPAMYPYRGMAEAGGLMAYGPNVESVFRRAAAYVDKILKGTKPADLPVEQPMRFELVINLKTAKALGLTIPQSILVRADQVIQ